MCIKHIQVLFVQNGNQKSRYFRCPDKVGLFVKELLALQDCNIDDVVTVITTWKHREVSKQTICIHPSPPSSC